jgi:hypothetical protein
MILGLDVSTSIVGIALMDADSLHAVSFVDLRKIDDVYEKSDMVSSAISEVGRSGVENVFIEDRLAGFSRGGTMQQTLLKLAGFNSVVSYISYSVLNVVPVHIHTSTIKSTLKREGLIIPKGSSRDKKKLLTLEWVRKEYPSFRYEETRNGNPQTYCYDMADAIVVALTGYRKFLDGKQKDRSDKECPGV